DQKGLDLLAQSASDLVREKIQLVVLGEGSAAHHHMLGRLSREFPRQVGVHIAQDEALAHQIEAGADMFLMPSQYEPCGLNQLYSMRYGTVPIVRAIGGLDDTVENFDQRRGIGNGFKFHDYSAGALLEKIREALYFYGKPQAWRAIQRNGMVQDN